LIKVSNDYVWVWVAIEPIDKVILDIRISFERTMLVVAEQFLKGLVNKYGKHSISTDGATWYPPQACKFLKIKHHIHSYYDKSIVERTIQYLKDRTECFDDYFPCRKYNCKLEHVIKWLDLFANMYNKMILRCCTYSQRLHF
jgi:putative transposase